MMPDTAVLLSTKILRKIVASYMSGRDWFSALPFLFNSRRPMNLWVNVEATKHFWAAKRSLLKRSGRWCIISLLVPSSYPWVSPTGGAACWMYKNVKWMGVFGRCPAGQAALRGSVKHNRVSQNNNALPSELHAREGG